MGLLALLLPHHLTANRLTSQGVFTPKSRRYSMGVYLLGIRWSLALNDEVRWSTLLRPFGHQIYPRLAVPVLECVIRARTHACACGRAPVRGRTYVRARGLVRSAQTFWENGRSNLGGLTIFCKGAMIPGSTLTTEDKHLAVTGLPGVATVADTRLHATGLL